MIQFGMGIVPNSNEAEALCLVVWLMNRKSRSLDFIFRPLLIFINCSIPKTLSTVSFIFCCLSIFHDWKFRELLF